MKIALFGEDVYSAVVLQSLINERYLINVVFCPFHKENDQYRKLEKIASTHAIDFFCVQDVNGREVLAYLEENPVDIIVCAHLRKVLSRNIFSLAKKHAINIHPSLLPAYRGLSPQHRAIMNGDKETGVTVHFIEETVDTGDIIIQEKITLSQDTYIYNLQMDMLKVYQHIVVKAVKLLEEEQFIPIKQQAGGSWFGSLKKTDRAIMFDRNPYEIYNLIRAVSKPYKGAFANGITFWASEIPDEQVAEKYLLRYPSQGIYIEDDLAIIRLKGGVLVSDDFEKMN